jgi:hypothetical protein
MIHVPHNICVTLLLWCLLLRCCCWWKHCLLLHASCMQHEPLWEQSFRVGEAQGVQGVGGWESIVVDPPGEYFVPPDACTDAARTVAGFRRSPTDVGG